MSSYSHLLKIREKESFLWYRVFQGHLEKKKNWQPRSWALGHLGEQKWQVIYSAYVVNIQYILYDGYHIRHWKINNRKDSLCFPDLKIQSLNPCKIQNCLIPHGLANYGEDQGENNGI